MPRYIARVVWPRMVYDDLCEWSSRDAHKGSIDVHEPREEPEETGLYDHHGNPLLRLPDEPRPIGFLADLDAE